MTPERLMELNKWDDIVRCCIHMFGEVPHTINENEIQFLMKNEPDFEKELEKLRSKYLQKYERLLKEA